jgi:ABC-type sugar transport system ATPase subunit
MGGTSGEISVGGERVAIRNPLDAIRYGIGYLPENRKEEGILPFLEVYKNITLSALSHFTRNGFLDKDAEKMMSQRYVSALNIKTPSLDSLAFSLSGGNQQKIMFSRALMNKPRVLLLDEPTQGIDVGSKFEIYQLIKRLSEEGVGIVFVSSDISELLGLCHRILVLCQGRITAELNSEEAEQEKIMYYATRFDLDS